MKNEEEELEEQKALVYKEIIDLFTNSEDAKAYQKLLNKRSRIEARLLQVYWDTHIHLDGGTSGENFREIGT